MFRLARPAGKETEICPDCCGLIPGLLSLKQHLIHDTSASPLADPMIISANDDIGFKKPFAVYLNWHVLISLETNVLRGDILTFVHMQPVQNLVLQNRQPTLIHGI